MGLGKNRDLISGAVLAVAGAAIVLYALGRYQLGSFARMGPGMFPVGIGGILGMLGLIIAADALRRGPAADANPDADPEDALHPRPLIVILLTVIVFALTLQWFGLIPAIFATTLLSALAHPGARAVSMLVLGASLSFAAVVIFRVLLNIPFPLLRWPFP